MDDYYELVGVERSAPREIIDRRIREEMRTWQRRTSNADLDRRQEAERRVKQLGEARITLLDETKRRRYDRTLVAMGSSQSPEALTVPLSEATMPLTRGSASGATANGTTAGRTAPDGTVANVDAPASPATMLDRARGYLAASDYRSAAYAVREVLRGTPNPTAEMWAILARADAALGQLDDALFEAHRAVKTDARDINAQLTLAWVHEARQEWVQAGHVYEVVARLDPHSEASAVGMARALARAGRPASAVERLEQRYSRGQSRPVEGRLMARALLEVAETVIRPPTGYRPERTAELGLVQRVLDRSRQVTSDPHLLRTAHRLQQELAQVRMAHRSTVPGYDQRRGHLAGGAAPRTNVLATIALVLAVLGLATFGVTGFVGAILGHVARAQIAERGEQGNAAAVAAIVLGWSVTVVACCAGSVMFRTI